ncbi:rRNA maturation RNase YbeY [Patescibacteria group bacterium]|nr:rRNA maturation RNase YbeY [Patescibacteria group bacterium]MDE2173195.1 rRNA maturation RNase YbeY [Patescibacteria group bacterium]
MASVSIKNLTRRTSVPRFAYTDVSVTALPGWDISLVFVAPARARALNERLRGATYTPNVLSYVSGTRSGEIIICLREAEKQATAYAMSERVFVLYLFIHGLLHLKGMAHGGTMEKRERTLLAQFATSGVRAHPHVPTHRHRNRHRHVPGKAGRRRGTRG